MLPFVLRLVEMGFSFNIPILYLVLILFLQTVEFECLELAVKSRMKAREESLKVNYIVGGTIVAAIVLIISFYVFHRIGLLSYI